jgi:Membrane dipeptidase (Peptidase family M19)
VDIPRLRERGMHAPFFAFWVPVYYQGAEAVRRALDLRDAMQSLLDAHPDQIALATTATDIKRVVKSGKIAAARSADVLQAWDAVYDADAFQKQQLGGCVDGTAGPQWTDCLDAPAISQEAEKVSPEVSAGFHAGEPPRPPD